MADVTLSSILTNGFPYRKQAIITSSQTWTLPSTAAPVVDYDIIAGGGGGFTTTGVANSRGGGGGGGGRRKGTITLVPGTGYPVVVGSAGTAGATSGTSTDGGLSSFAGVSAPGGGASNTESGGTAGLKGMSGYAISVPGADANGNGGSGYDGFCSGGGGGSSTVAVGLGGDGAGNGSFNADAASATRPGCGGGGAGRGAAGTVYKGGNGYRGEVRITYWDSVP